MDIGTSHIMPRKELPRCLFKEIEKHLKERLILGSNPSRILYLGKEIVITRFNALKQIRRNSIINPKDDNYTYHLAYTILSQRYLSPLTPIIRPV